MVGNSPFLKVVLTLQVAQVAIKVPFFSAVVIKIWLRNILVTIEKTKIAQYGFHPLVVGHHVNRHTLLLSVDGLDPKVQQCCQLIF